MIFKLFYLIVALIFTPFISLADEVGNKMFVVKPIAKPIYTTKSGTKIFPCNGFINKKLIPIIYNELVIPDIQEALEMYVRALGDSKS